MQATSMSLATGQMNQTATGDLRIDKKEQAKSLKTIQDYTDVGEYSKAIKYINLRKKS
jgi:hypothetical protein